MRRLALQGSIRRLLTRLHRWSGLTVMAVVTIAAVTGVALAFRHEIDAFVNPRLRVVTPGPHRASLQQVIERVEARFDDARVATITLPTKPQDSLIVYLGRKPVADGGTGQELQFTEAFVNPYTAEILGQRRSGQVVFTREHLIPLLIRLHHSLLLGRVGVWMMGTSAIVWLLTSILGLALAWPAVWRRTSGWVQTLSVRRHEGRHKLHYDLHRALGVSLLPVWIVLAFTSVYLNFPGLIRATTAMFSPTTGPPVAPSNWAGGPIVTPDDAIASALAAVPSASAFGFTRDFPKGLYSIRLRMPGDINPAGNSHAYVAFSTGRVTALRLASSAPAGQRFLFWQFPLHSGVAFGRPGRMSIAASGLVLAAIGVTGLHLWLRGRSARRLIQERL